MTRLPLIGAIAAGLLIGVLPPTVASASTGHVAKISARTHALEIAARGHASGTAARTHVGGTGARTHVGKIAARPEVAGIAAPITANPVPQGSSLGPSPVAQSPLLLPQVLGVTDTAR